MGLASIKNTFAAGAVAVAGMGAVAPEAEAGIVTSYFQGTVVGDTTGGNFNGLTVFGDAYWDDTFPDSFGSPTVGGYLGSLLTANFEWSNEFETVSTTASNGNSVFVNALALPAQDSITFSNFSEITSTSLNVSSVFWQLSNSGSEWLTNDSFSSLNQATINGFTGLNQIVMQTDLGQITIQVENMTVVPTPGTTGLALVGLGAMALGGGRRRNNDAVEPAAAAPQALEPQGPA